MIVFKSNERREFNHSRKMKENNERKQNSDVTAKDIERERETARDSERQRGTARDSEGQRESNEERCDSLLSILVIAVSAVGVV